MSRRWRVDLPLTRPLSLNARQHWSAKQRGVRTFRQATAVAVKQQRIPQLERVSICLHYIPRDRRRRDPLNLVATLKPCEDGIVDAGVIPDDTEQFSQPTMPVIDEPDSGATVRLYLVITELEALS